MKTTTTHGELEFTELTNEDAAEVMCRNSGLELETPANAHRRVVTMAEQMKMADEARKANTAYANEAHMRNLQRAKDEEFRWTVGV